MPTLSLQVSYDSLDALRAAFDAEISRGGLLVRGATLVGAAAGADVTVTVNLGGQPAAQLPARVAAVVPGVGVAVMFQGVPAAISALLAGEAPALDAPLLDAALAEPEPEPEAPAPPGSLTDRLKQMTVNEKMKLALSGGRDERAALFRDINKTLHLFVLKNPRIGLDEVQAAAKLAQLSPDAVKYIADHRDWGSNATICTSLVRNPKTPMPLALRMLDRVPLSEVRVLAKGGAREAIVHAARKKIAG